MKKTTGKKRPVIIEVTVMYLKLAISFNIMVLSTDETLKDKRKI
jgi:hypothetical protein